MTTIQVHSFYQDISGKKIQAGLYNIDDPSLHKIGGYLVNNGHATVIESIEFEPFEPLPLSKSAQDAVDESDIETLYDDLQDYFEGSGLDKIGIGNVREYMETLT